MFIDIHTHSNTTKKGISIYSLYENFDLISDSRLYSIGFHPAFIANDLTDSWIIFVNAARMKQVVAIGECGLDKICSTEFNLQMEVFKKHIQLAKELQKPLIIHCVKSWQELTDVLNKLHSKVPVIIHGFNNNLNIARLLISKGFYLSFGKSIFFDRMHNVLQNVPIEKVFFETDNSDLSIQEIYNAAAKILHMDQLTLSALIQRNAANVFGNIISENHE